VRKRTLLARRERRRPSDETEHKLRSEDVFCQLRLGRENLLEFVWRDGVIAPYRDAFAGKRNRIRPWVIAPYPHLLKRADL
jgi:hypothetical protein